jgi:hypothetical protein
MSYHILTPDPYEGNASRNTASGYLKCRVCKRGVLENKKLYRLSGPAVVIGYILLIPSVLGMIASLLLFLGVIAFNPEGVKTEAPETQAEVDTEAGQLNADTQRHSCRDGFIELYKDNPGSMPTHAVITANCECILSETNTGVNLDSAVRFCHRQFSDGMLSTPSNDTIALYFPATSEPAQQSSERATFFWNILRTLGGVFAIYLGISSFVGGLLGWLLVMKRQVLQCTICGATINAS